ncbi:hypothetical protein FXN80_10865 [Dickeya fangzhongdai]|uniref:hypothetical protein n=1 Tax=Dickeya fangzhongdai TaxID=1778540 RepID=UPI001371DD0F|nr:hypothetical protein [Dickeya fangzhongdai]UMB78862.1 hypothetical protein FXN80_10865 [Dickeya fangzhongdai]
MGLRYSFHDNGYPGLFFSENMNEMVKPRQCFEISGEQKEIHKYLDTIGENLSDQLQIIYEFESGSRETAAGFSDAIVHLFFCTSIFNSLTQEEFREKLIDPYSNLFN